MAYSQLSLKDTLIPGPDSLARKYFPRRYFSYSTHFPDILVSDWMEQFKFRQTRMREQYGDSLKARLKNYSRFKDYLGHNISLEIGMENIRTGLRETDTYSTAVKYSENLEKTFVETNIPILKSLVLSDIQEETLSWFKNCYEENPDGCKVVLQHIYTSLLVEDTFNEKAIINLLRVIGDFDYEEMNPIGVIILTSAISLNSDKVKSAAMDVLSHWPNKETYNLIRKLAPPVGFLYKIQYDSVLKSFEKRYGLHAEDRH